MLSFLRGCGAGVGLRARRVRGRVRSNIEAPGRSEDVPLDVATGDQWMRRAATIICDDSCASHGVRA
jgi:hypothetical protein